MTTIAVVRGDQEFQDHMEKRLARLDREIEDARRGVVANISREAAARFLGVSTKTLYRQIQAGEGPPHQKAVSKGAGKNQHLRFPFPDLEAWDNARTQYGSPEDRQKLREEAARNAIRRQIAEQEAQLQALRNQLRDSGDRRVLAFEGVSSVAQPQPWIFDGDQIVGHALCVPVEDLDAGEVIFLSMDEALMEDWVKAEEREYFHEILASELRQAVARSEAWGRKMKLSAVLDAEEQRLANSRTGQRPII